MKVNVIILAGGTGSRMNAGIPKQFIKVDGVPIIVDTIKNFEKNNRINSIVVVCLKEWIPHLNQLIREYKLTKILDVIPGGATGHHSSRNGVLYFKNLMSDDDFLIIHDAARPLLPQEIINQMINVAFKEGNACTAIPINDTVIETNDQKSGIKQIERSSIMRVQTPQAYNYKLIKNLYEKADQEGKCDFIYANTMALYYGVRIFLSKGFNANLKLTTKQDIAFYKAMKKFSEEELIK